MFAVAEMGNEFVHDFDGIIERIFFFKQLVEHPIYDFSKLDGFTWKEASDLMEIAG